MNEHPPRNGPVAIVLSWHDGEEAFSARLGTDAGPTEIVFEAGTERMPLPPGTRLILERTSSGLWWASARGPDVKSWTADGAGLHLAQAIAVGSTLQLGALKVLVWGPELTTEVPRTPRTPIGAPLDDEEEAPASVSDDGASEQSDAVFIAGTEPDSSATVRMANARDGAIDDDASTDEDPEAGLGALAPVPPLGGDPSDDRLVYNLSAPRDELLGGGTSERSDHGGRDDERRTNPPAPPAPLPPPSSPVPSPASAELDDAIVFRTQTPHATPATALPRAPGPSDVWLVHLEHRFGATTRELTVVHPPTMNTMLIVGRDPDSALHLADPEVASLQLGLQLLQGEVRVHPWPDAELALVVDGRQADRPRRLREGAILSFGRHALRLVSTRIVPLADVPPSAQVPRTVYQPARLALQWQVERPGRSPRAHSVRLQADLGRPPRVVVGSKEPADWVLPGIGPELERVELWGGALGEVIVQPVGGRVVVDGRPVASHAAMRRGQVLEAGGVRLMLIEAEVEAPCRQHWTPTGGSTPRWIDAAPPPAVEGRKLVLDVRAHHPSGGEELISVVAQAGWGASCVTLGREEDNDLILRVPTVSRTHAVLRFVGGGISLRDVSGRGSAWVNRRPAETDTVVLVGDHITLGEVRLDLVGVSFQGPEQDHERRRVRVTVALQVSGAEGPELYRVDRVIWSDRTALLRVGAHPSSDITLPGAPISLGRFEVGQRGVVFVDGTGQGGRFYGGRSFERAVELVEGDAVEVGGVLMRYVGAKVVDLDA